MAALAARTAEGSLRRTPTQRRAQDRVRRILDAADALLARDGALGTRPVAVAAGVSIGSLYHWFPDKESIALALALRHWEELSELVAEIADRAQNGRLSDPVGEAFRALAAGFRARPGFLALWFGELRTEQLRAATRPSRERVAGSVGRILAVTHPESDPELRTTVARVVTLLGDGVLREAFRIDRGGDALLLAEGAHALRAYVAERLGGGDD
ncbi:MAG TPA: TetR/AcrR family transcriptional regulator [Solirubrobacteraceae bacterium]|nr:TetR/AcrR family transcriptional regulator [Solirubrobacteraceae bacterium]